MKAKQLLISLTVGLGLVLSLLWLLNGRSTTPVTAAPAAATRYVDDTGSDATDCSSVVSPCQTIQYAVDQAGADDEIRVAGGDYAGVQARGGVTQVVYISQSLTLRGGYNAAFTETNPISYPTTLDAQGQGRVIYVVSNLTVTLEGLQIINGATASGDDGGGVYREDYDANGHLTIRNCDISSNASFDNGGGVYVHSGALILKNNQLTNNTAAGDGGGIYAREATVTMTQDLLQDNASGWETEGWAQGGGACLYECTAYVADNIFQDNISSRYSGGLGAMRGKLTLTHNTFLNNTANEAGGGIYASSDSDAYTITYNTFQGNTAAVTRSTGRGGGACLSGGKLVFSHNRVLNNVASECKTQWSKGEGGGLYLGAYDTPALVSDNLFQGNWGATDYDCTGTGGGIFVASQTQLQMERNRVLDNRASRYPDWGRYFKVRGGGVFVGTWSVVTMTNNIIAGNRYFEEDDNPFASDYYSYGGAIHIGHQSTPANTQLYLYHNTIADNQSPAILNESSGITMSHNILSGHSTDLRTIFDTSAAGDSLSPATIADHTLWHTSMDVEIENGTFTHDHDFTGDPEFVITPHDNYHLAQSSAAIDKGAGAGVTSDIDGNPRPLYADYDLGADEYTGVDLYSSTKSASPQQVVTGEEVTFTIVLRNTGASNAPNTVLFDSIPADCAYVPGSVWASSGTATDADGIGWQGDVAAGQSVTIIFRITAGTGAMIENTAVVTDTYGTSVTMTAWVNALRVYLPLVMRGH